jgi:hypothetical protein
MFVSTTIAATSGVPHDKSGLASGILNTSQQIGGALGLAILSGIYADKVKDSLAAGATPAVAQVAGSHDAFIVGACFAAFASFLSVVAIQQKKGEKIDVEDALHAV